MVKNNARQVMSPSLMFTLKKKKKSNTHTWKPKLLKIGGHKTYHMKN